MTTKHEIEIEGLPEGYEVSKVTVEEHGITRTWKEGKRMAVKAEIKLRKIKPRRIVLEETEESNTITSGIWDLQRVAGLKIWHEPKIWREVEEGE